MKRSVTILDIAKQTQLTQGTVSAVLSGRAAERRISQATQKVVLKAAREMKYSPNRLARSLRVGRSAAIAIFWSSHGPHNASEIISAIAGKAYGHGYSPYVVDHLQEPELTSRMLEHMHERRVDGLVLQIGSHLLQDQNVRELLAGFKAVVLVIRGHFEDFDLDGSVDAVIHEDQNALEAIADHFVAINRRRIAAILPADSYSIGQAKMEKFFRRVSEHGLALNPEGTILFPAQDDYRYADGFRQALDARFSGSFPFDAIWCGTDEGAARTIQWLRGKGLRVPEDVAVVGFNDSEFAASFDPPIASCGREEKRVAYQVGKFLHTRLIKGELAPRRAIVNMRFIWRESAGGDRFHAGSGPKESHLQGVTKVARKGG